MALMRGESGPGASSRPPLPPLLPPLLLRLAVVAASRAVVKLRSEESAGVVVAGCSDAGDPAVADEILAAAAGLTTPRPAALHTGCHASSRRRQCRRHDATAAALHPLQHDSTVGH